MLHDENTDGASDHEGNRRNERSTRHAAQSAHAMAARTTIAQARAKSNEQSAHDGRAKWDGIGRGKCVGAHEKQDEAGNQKAGNEKNSFGTVLRFTNQRSANNAADASNSTTEQEKDGSREADEGSADEGRDGGERGVHGCGVEKQT